MIDVNLECSDAQAITSSTAASTNIIDFGVANPNQGAGGKWRYMVQVGTAFAASAGSPTLEVDLQESSDNSTWDELHRSDVWTAAECALNKKVLNGSLPDEHLRYLRFFFDVATSSFSAGAVSAYLYTMA